jgi:hypothetical protein
MTAETNYFEALASALYEGPTKAADFKIMPGDNVNVNRETRSEAALASMKRLRIVVDGHLASLDGN